MDILVQNNNGFSFLDSGYTVSITPNVSLENYNIATPCRSSPWLVHGASSAYLNVISELTVMVSLSGNTYNHPFVVVNDLAFEMITKSNGVNYLASQTFLETENYVNS